MVRTALTPGEEERKMQGQGRLGKWLLEICQQQGLSLRQAGVRVGLSHGTIRDIINGAHPLPATIKKLARAFGGNGRQRLALEDKLLTLAGCRTERPSEKLTELLAQLMDKVKGFNELQIKMMVRFADFLVEIEGK